MSFISALPEGISAVAAGTDALAGATAGLSGPAAAAGAVVPPGVEEISLANATRITEHTEHVAAMLGAASTVKAMYGVSTGLSGATYSLVDAMNAANVGAVI